MICSQIINCIFCPVVESYICPSLSGEPVRMWICVLILSCSLLMRVSWFYKEHPPPPKGFNFTGLRPRYTWLMACLTQEGREIEIRMICLWKDDIPLRACYQSCRNIIKSSSSCPVRILARHQHIIVGCRSWTGGRAFSLMVPLNGSLRLAPMLK